MYFSRSRVNPLTVLLQVNPPIKFEEIVMVMINVFIFNKLDFQNCFLPFLTLKQCMNIKSLSKSQF